MNTNKIILGEKPFLSFQGEGLYTGKNTVWLRLFSCNLTCDGFFQNDPTDPSTYELPYENVDITKIKMVEDLPVFSKGCDSSYSWSKKYKHLLKEYTASEIVDELDLLLVNGKFQRNTSNHHINTHLCFTGGEPLLKPNQKNVMRILFELERRDNLPANITFETNTTTELLPEFIELIKHFQDQYDIEFLASCSPKLFNVSGELNKKAWKFDVLQQYYNVFQKLSLKFVVNDKQATWDELDTYVNTMSISTDNIYIMPVGATVEQQSESVIANIANKALARGFNVSGRLHCYMFGNGIGT